MDNACLGEGRHTCSLPVECWPSADRQAWLAGITPATLLDERGPAADLAPSTKEGAWRAYGRWLRWLTTSQPTTTQDDFTHQVTPAAIAAYVLYLQTKTANSSVVAYLAFLQVALRIMAPDADWSWLKPIIARIKHMPTPVRRKRLKIVPSNELMEFGFELMAKSSRIDGTLTCQNANGVRDGLMVALLAMRPFRRKNFVAIEIGRHLIERAGALWICFEGHETKNGEPIELPVPERLRIYLHYYIDQVRPFLCAQTSHRDPRHAFREPGMRLWISKTGSALSGDGFYKNITKRTAEKFGHSVNPHLFRDCLITQLATDDPDHVQMAPLLLGHKTPHTAERFYNHAGAHQATQKLQKHVLATRRGRADAAK